jgi:hypothetical protein
MVSLPKIFTKDTKMNSKIKIILTSFLLLFLLIACAPLSDEDYYEDESYDSLESEEYTKNTRKRNM